MCGGFATTLFFFVVQYSTRPVFAFIKYIKQYFFRKLMKTKSFVTQIVSYLYFCSLIIILIEYYVDNYILKFKTTN